MDAELDRLEQSGLALSANGQYRQALDVFKQIKRDAPQKVSSRIYLAETLGTLGRKKEALEELQEAVRIEPRNAFLYMNIALILHERGDSAGAKECLQKAVEVSTDLGTREMALYYTASLEGRYEDALRHLETVHSLSPAYDRIFALKGDTLLSLGRHEEALFELGRAARAPHVSAKTLYNLARVHEYLGDRDNAIPIYWQSMRKEFHDLKAFDALTKIYFARRQWGNAFKVLFWMLRRLAGSVDRL